jgi:signal transduction histidine kinase/CheY-like chemotaxis protein
LLAANGELEGLVGLYHDLSERRAVEEMRTRLHDTEEQLRHSQKMEAIGVLAGGVAHDFNNLLSVILSYAVVLRDDMPADDERRGELDEIRAAAERAASLTRQLLAFSRKQVLEPRRLDMKETLQGMTKMLRRLLGEDVSLSLRTPDQGGVVLADPGQIEQVIMNLAVNARDAMPRGGALTIDVSDVECAADEVPPGTSPGRFVRIDVRDNGSGMDAATKARIFEPFYTTKRPGEGTGLGLSTVFGIVAQSDGYITVESAVGQGTTFSVFLPRVANSNVVPLEKPVVNAAAGSETILLVEDDERVRRVVEKILRRRGYQVLEAENAGEALVVAERHEAPIHLLLSDLVMPRMSGRELAERLQPLRPEMKVLFMTGYTADAILRHGVAEGTVALIHKPVNIETLARRVRELLDQVHAAAE